MRYALTETGHGHVWGVCAAVEGLFGEPQRGTYELLDWVPEGAEVCGWVGSRVWLVPEGEALDPWLLEDVESPGQRSWTNSLVLTGLDDYEGPPEGHRRRVRVHDGHRWLGSCREFTRIVPPEPGPEPEPGPGHARPPLVLRGLAQSDQLRAALAKGTRRALNLEEASLEIRDERGEPLAERLLWTEVSSWHPSDLGPGPRAPGPASTPGAAWPGSISSASEPAEAPTVTGRLVMPTNSTAGTSPTSRACTWRSVRP
ncbi:putative LigA protein [Streptomyces viridochromogenes Tue57]|uniref:Putative LigA protein n=1 Tax=Streptomyces viridochromogenes Tue57 TaxID=1160705 RepID=L8P610_STRVR|nr:putative LigA protein [Streptomyces viridochromogenes Tue57]